MAKTLYDLIGVARNAAKQDIEAACTLRAKRYSSADSGESETYKKFWLAEIEKARSVLTDDKAKAEYDASLPPINIGTGVAAVAAPGIPPSVPPRATGSEPQQRREPLFTLGERRNQFIVAASALAAIVALATGGAYFATHGKSTPVESKSQKAMAPDPLEQAALTALAKLHAKTDVGVNYRDFGQELGEANFHVKAYLDSLQPRSNPKLTETIENAFETYKKALAIWRLRIEDRISDRIHYVPGETVEQSWGGGSPALPQIAKIVPNYDDYAADSGLSGVSVRTFSTERLVRVLVTEAGATVELAQQLAITQQIAK